MQPFTTIVADPPWQYRDKLKMGGDQAGTPHRGHRGAESHYPCMATDDICALGGPGHLVGLPIAEPAHLYLWVTNAFMEDGHRVARAWGFTPRTILTWVKPQIGMGHYFRNNTEHVIFAVRGTLPTLRRDCPTAFTANRRRHSQKPDEFFEIVESMSVGPYLEVFARRPREGWTVWGNEVEP